MSLNVRRTIVIFFSLILSLSLGKVIDKKESITTMSWQSVDKIIVLDAGHGLPDERSI